MFKSISSSSLNVNGSGEVPGGGGNNNGGIAAGGIQKSHTVANCVVEKERGFKPSDRHDPNKKQFLTQLSEQIWQKRNVSFASHRSKKKLVITLEHFFCPF